MNTIEVATWEDFQREVQKLREFETPTSPLIYRGHTNADWTLTTTLERSGERRMSFRDYYELICGIGPEIATFAGLQVPEYKQGVADSFSQPSLLMRWPGGIYQYMAWLRHLGFPSPLLDWSRSPYVAAFFAFREEPLVPVLKRSIYAYCEKPQGAKGGRLGDPMMTTMGPYVQTHHRHFRQRCEYTVCGRFDNLAQQWYFDSHQKVFENTAVSQMNQQDSLWKVNLPSNLRETILRVLNDYNLNAFSVFGSEESLLETMWFKEHVLRQSSFREHKARMEKARAAAAHPSSGDKTG